MIRKSAIALLVLAAGCASAEQKTLERTFAVSPGGTLTVDADSASVRVSGGNTNEVIIRMRVRGSQQDIANIKLDAFQKDGGVTVTMRREKDGWFKWRSWNGGGDIEVTVPQRYAIDVQTSGGGVELTGTTGFASLKTSGGGITAKNVNGNVEARTSGGGIFADTIRGDIDADTSGGTVRLLHIDGKIRGHTSGGSVECSLVGSNRGISATTSGGSIQLTLPRSVTANVEATTSGGGFRSELPVTADEQDDSHFEGSINGGGPPIEAHTSGGGISLRAAN